MKRNTNLLKGWLPTQLSRTETGYCEWLFTDKRPFCHPFFAESIAHSRSMNWTMNPQHLRSVSALDLLPSWAGYIHDAVEPSAFIFHVSRCGSTLACQLLTLDPANIVLSEVPFFDQLLRDPDHVLKNAGLSADQLLPAAMRFYGQRRTGQETRLFAKLDSWHVAYHQIIRRIFPTTPIILMYRRPDEVLRSHKNRKGYHAVPGLIDPKTFGFAPDVTQLHPDAYLELLLEHYFNRFITVAQTDPFMALVDYAQGPFAIMEQIAKLTNMQFSESQLIQLRERTRFHSKEPSAVFDETPIDEDTEVLKRPVFTAYNKLNELRNNYRTANNEISEQKLRSS